MFKLFAVATALTLPIVSCARDAESTIAEETAENGAAMPADPHSYARPEQVAVSHLHLDLTVDFDRQMLEGNATLDLDRRDPEAYLMLDTRDLSIDAVETTGGRALTYELGEADALRGRPLRVELPSEVEQVVIRYSTSPQAAALQWLDPAQTESDQPFLFSQSQAILARTWVPCQDTPGVRFSYTADLQVPPGLLALMSAENPQEVSDDGRYSFSMPQPIPSYLLAVAVGDLEFVPLGEHTGVYAEPAVIEDAAWEFAEVEQMLEAAERLYGDYAWGRYDLLVLPPSFPFGGMENPRLTFATPTILAGDRSLVALVAHELAHSWSGNLATNANWDDFWLNEGFTTYIEGRLMEELYGPEYAAMLDALSFQDLADEVDSLGAESAATHLRLNLAGKDPDAGMTSIAYEKGALLLRTLEEELGREQLDGFLSDWFSDNAFQSVTSDQLMAALRRHFPDRDELWERVESEWVDGPGIPAEHASTSAEGFAVVDEAVADWTAEGAVPPWADWNTHQRLHFLRALDEPQSEELARLDAALELTESGNSEIAAEWFETAIEAGYTDVNPQLRRFLLEVGRRKFLRPLYEALATTDSGLRWAREVYAEARPGYHSVSQGTIDEILGWDGEAN